MRFVALDIGDRKVGVATGDSEFRMAFPQPVFERTGDDVADARRLGKACVEHGAEELIVGLPLSQEGGETDQSSKIRAFAELLPFPSRYRNEAFTTSKAEALMTDAGASRKRRSETADSVAAGILLQEYLDELGG